MQTATNPQTGERIYLNEQTGEWEDLVTATNPETGEKVFLQGEQWVPLEVSTPPADPGAMPAEPGAPGELPQVGQVSAPGMAETVTPAAPTFQDLFDEVEAQHTIQRATDDIENPMREKGSALDDLMIGWLGLQNAGAAAPVMAGDAYAQRRGVMLDRLADRFGLDVGGTSQAELEGTVSDLGAAVMPGIVERADRVAEIPQSEAAQEVFSAGTWGEALKGFVENPGEVTRTAVFQSLPLSAPSMIGAILGQVAGPKGAAMGAGFGGGLTELGATSAEGLMTALKQAGVDTSDKEAVKEFFTDNAEVLDPIWKEGLTRGGVIGAFDALGGYIVGNMARSVALGTRGQRIAAVPAGTGIEGTAGATGEAAASKIVDGEIVPGQVLAEAIGEAGAGGPSAVGQIAVESIRNPRNQILTENLRALADDIDRGVFTGDINEAVIEALRTPQTVENTPRQFSTPKMDVPPTVAAPVAPQVNTDVPESFVPPGGEAAPQVTPEEPVAQTPAPAQPEAPVAPQSPVAQTEPPAQPQVEPQEGQETVAVSNPGGQWLEGKRAAAERDMREADPENGTAARGLNGSTTAYTRSPVALPTSILVSIEGANNEAPAPGTPKYDALLASVEEQGFSDESPILIRVNHLGQPYIMEGNTRVAVAAATGVPSVRAEVQWMNGAEEAPGVLTPETVVRAQQAPTGPAAQTPTEQVGQPTEVTAPKTFPATYKEAKAQGYTVKRVSQKSGPKVTDHRVEITTPEGQTLTTSIALPKGESFTIMRAYPKAVQQLNLPTEGSERPRFAYAKPGDELGTSWIEQERNVWRAKAKSGQILEVRKRGDFYAVAVDGNETASMSSLTEAKRRAFADAERQTEAPNETPQAPQVKDPLEGSNIGPNIEAQLDKGRQKSLRAARKQDGNVADVISELEDIYVRARAQAVREGLSPTLEYVIDEATGFSADLIDAWEASGKKDLDYPTRDEDTGEFEYGDDPLSAALMFIDQSENFVTATQGDYGGPDAGADVSRMDADEVFPPPANGVVNIDTQIKGDVIPQEDADQIMSQWREAAKQVGRERDNSNKFVISLFDYTGNWSKPWEDAGYQVIKYDIKAGADLILNDWIWNQLEELRASGAEVYGILAACPCTTFSSAGARWWDSVHDVESEKALRDTFGKAGVMSGAKSPVDYNKMLVDATKDFVAQAAPTNFHVIENPIGRISEKAGLPEPAFRFQPHNFGDPYTKRTQIFGITSTDLPTANVRPTQGSKIHKMGSGDPARSTTPEGFAYAFFIANDPDAKRIYAEMKAEQEGRNDERGPEDGVREGRERPEGRRAGDTGRPGPDDGGVGEGVERGVDAGRSEQTGRRSRVDKASEANVQRTAAKFGIELKDDADVGAKPGRRPKGKLSPGFLKFSYTNKPSVHRAAWNDAGVDPDTARMKDLDWQIRTLSKMVEDRYGIKVTVGRRPAVVKNAVGRKVMTDKPELQSRKAIDQLLDAYATLEMLAAVMGVPHKALALPIDGKPLTLELTSQRKLQGALGMFAYGGDRRVIYMPERSNSFAHEWGHALDHWLASQVDHPLLGQMLSRSMSQEGMTPEVAFTHPHRPVTDAFTQVLISMFKGDARVGAIRLRLQIAASQTDPDGNPTPSARIAQKALDDMSDFKNIPEKYTSDYFKNAKEYDEAYQAGGYFTDPAEMFARAFEAFVGRSVARETDAPANFLTKGAWAYDDKNDQRNELTFPKGLDGMRFAVAMTRLSEAMRQTLDMPKGEVAALNPDPDLIPPFLIEGDPIREKAVKREWNAVQQVVKDIMATGRDNAVQVEEKLHRAVTRRFIHSAAGALHDIARKYDGPAKKAIDTIAMRIGKRQGYGQFTGTQWQEAMEAYALGRINRVTREAKKIWADGNIPKVEQKYVRRALLGLEDEKIGPDPNMRARAKKFASIVNRITDGVWYDLDSVGFKLGYQRGYLPFIHHKGLTDSKPDEFRAQAKKVYRLMFEREVKNQADEAEQDKDINRALNLLRNDTKATPSGDRAPQPWVAPSDEKLIADWRAAKAKRNKLRKQLEEADDPKRAAEIEAKLRPAEAEEAQMREQVLDVLEDLWSDYSVEHWYVKQGVGAINDFDTMGPSTNFMQGRRFPPEAADILEDFMVSDPMELLQGYIFGAARQLHYARLFGLPVQMAEGGEVIGGDLKNMLEAARQGGVSSEDIEAIKVAVNAATGRITTDPVASRLFGKVSAYGQAALLALAPLSSLAEPLVVALRSGSMRDAGRAVLSNLHNIASKGRRQDLYDLAMMMGMVADYTAETIIANRTSTDAISLSAQDRARISKFHQMTGLIPLTNYNRVANIPVAHHIILRLLRDSVEGKRTLNSRARDAVAGGQGKFADAELNELGISQENRQDLLDWLDGLEKGIPTQLDLLGTDGDMHDAGFLWARAIKRLTDETIQNTQKSDRAIAANNPYFAAMYSIMSFLDGFHRNIILRTLRRGVSEDAGNLSWERTWKGGANIALATMPALVLFGGHMISTMIREMLLNTEKMRDLEEDDEEYETMIGDLVEFATGADLTNSQRFILSRAASRTGLMGRYEPLVQLGTGVKYENDLTGMIAGPYNSFFLGSFQTVLETFVGRNSGNTNTSEWNAAQAAYRGVVQPAIAMSIANYFPAAGAVGKVGAAGLYYFSRYDASRGFADMAVGEKGRNYRDEGIPPPWFEMGSPR